MEWWKNLNSGFSKRNRNNGNKGFIISLDSAIAVVVLATAMLAMQVVMFQQQPSQTIQSMQKADDVFVALDNSGFLLEQVDLENLDVIASNIRSEALSLLPSDFNVRVELKKFSVNSADCRRFESFEKCFTLEETASSGISAFGGVSVMHDRKLFAKKQSPGDCNIVASFSKKVWEFPKKTGTAFFDFSKIFFQSSGGDLNIAVKAFRNGEQLMQDSTIKCDENILVDLNAFFPTTGRPPINLIFGADKSLSTGECAIAKGTVLDEGSGVTPSSFQKVREFSLSSNEAFDVLLEWSESCSSNCPKLYVISPNLTKYGFGSFLTTEENVSTCNSGDSLNSKAYYLSKSVFDYLAVNSNIANPKAGVWEVWVEKPGTPVNYDLTVKKIQNEYFDSISLSILSWNNPISKIELAQVFIARMNGFEFWDKEADEYAFAEIGKDKKSGGDGSSIQPSSGLRPIGDQAFKSQLKNLSPISTDFSAFGFGMSGTSMMNSTLASEAPAEVRVEILFGDGDSNGSPNAVSAANDAKDKNIIVFTVGFGQDFNFTDLKAVAQITGGEFYNAKDENALGPIFELIAKRVFALSGIRQGLGVPDLNIEIPISPSSIVSNPTSSFQGTFEIDSNFLRYFIHDINILSAWHGTYNLTYPCTLSCSGGKKYFPEFGTRYSYFDNDGNYFSNEFSANNYISVNFLYRDLVVSFERADLSDINRVLVSVKVANTADLNTLNYPLGRVDVNILVDGFLAGLKTVKGLCTRNDIACIDWFDVNSLEILQEGRITAVIDANAVKDCPLGNQASIICRSGLKTEFYSIDYYVWRNET